MNQFRFPRLTPTVKKLLILLGASFVLVAILENVVDLHVFQWLALDVDASRNASAMFLNLAWQPFTYWLVYPPVPNALLNFLFILLGIYFFLAPFEEAYGTKRTLQLAAAGVLAAAIPCIALGFVVTPTGLIAGSGAIALASLGAFPVIARGREILFMFVLPMKAWTVVLVGLGFAALSAVLARDPFLFVEYAGALGGGVLFARWMTKEKGPRPRSSGKPPPKRRGGPDLRVVRGGADDEKPRWLN